MAEQDQIPPTATPSGDLVSLDEANDSLDRGPGASSQDSILNAAEMFQQQLEQMTAWKHQLAQQMELMRRDGVKLLERQKALALEKKKATEDRDALVAEKSRLQQLQEQLEAETRRVAARATEIASAQAELQKLEAERTKWERDVADARRQVEALATQKNQTAADLAAAEARLAEIKVAEARRDDLQRQITEAESRLGRVQDEQRAIDTARHELELKNAELVARQKALAEQESHCLAEDLRLKEGLEALEAQRRHLVEAQRVTTHDKEALAAQQQQLASREQALAQQAQELAAREESLRSGHKETQSARQTLDAKQNELAQREHAIAEKAAGIESELRVRLAEAETFKQQAAEDRQALAKQRQELQKKLETLDHDHAEQLETLAKQTKRISERRNEIEAAERDLDKALEDRVSKATGALQEELAVTRAGYEKKLATLEAQIATSESAASSLRTTSERLQKELAETGAQLASVREELHQASTVLSHTKEENVTLARNLSAQVEEARKEAAKWQAALASAQSQESAGDASLTEAQQAASQARSELEALRGQLAALQQAHEQLQFQLELQTEDGKKALEAAQSQLQAELQKRDEQIAQWKEKYQTAKGSKSSAGETAKVQELAKQLETMEQQRNELANQLFEIQDNLRRQQEESLLTKNTLEGKLLSLEQKNATLEAEKATWKSSPHASHAPQTDQSVASISQLAQAQQQMSHQRERLLRRARALRAIRRQSQESRAALENSRAEIAQQREQLRARKENLEQVKRLLEKQEMVMARKLADHNAIKTVCAVGIFVIMILGSAFFGVYRFVHPEYRSEAVVQLAPPAELQGIELEAWFNRQMEFVRNQEVTAGAWKVLRSTEEHYAMHDVRDEWIASLPKHLAMQLDSSTKTLAIRYSGPDAEGVSQVCNSLASAYSQPTLRETTETTKAFGQGAQVLAKATAPLYPAEDHRLMIAMSLVATVLFVSLLLVMLFRHFVARQLREIDQMADAQDLEELHGDLAEGAAKPAGA